MSLFSNLFHNPFKHKTIGVFYICTGKYHIFWDEFYRSAEKYFCPGNPKQYFVFTDAEMPDMPSNVKVISQERLGWPDDTLKRFHIFQKAYPYLSGVDYLFFFNANMSFRNKVRPAEILPTDMQGLVGVIHPYYYEGPSNAPLETNPASTAFVQLEQVKHYLQGCLNGGTKAAYMEMADTLKQRVDEDEAAGLMAIWHDESQLNRYMAEKGGYKFLDPGFAKPEGRTGFPFKERIVQLDKAKFGGHHFLRS